MGNGTAPGKAEGPWGAKSLSAAIFTGLLVAAILAAGSYLWRQQSEAPPEGVSGLVGGCEAFTVFAQNRWAPLGTAVRAEPFGVAEKVGSFAPNELIAVDGWVRTRAPYPSNSEPWNSDKWFHLENNAGWVSFAGVRADPTTPDPTGFDEDGGRPAPTPDECSGSVR